MKIFLALAFLLIPPAMAIAQEPPGLNFWDTRTALVTLSHARVLSLQEPGKSPENIWIKALDVFPMSEGRWGIKINGKEWDWRQLYIVISGREVNLALAFQYSQEMDPERMNPQFEANQLPNDRP